MVSSLKEEFCGYDFANLGKKKKQQHKFRNHIAVEFSVLIGQKMLSRFLYL